MKNRQDHALVNERIRISPVRVIKDGQNLGMMSTNEAIRLARLEGLELVQISDSKPPVCRIMDYGKFKYEQNVKLKQQRKNSRETQLKEIHLRPAIGEHDLNTKIRAIEGFLQDGHPVHVLLRFKARENTHKEIGFEIINTIIEKIAACGKPRNRPSMQGSVLSCTIEPAVAK